MIKICKTLEEQIEDLKQEYVAIRKDNLVLLDDYHRAYALYRENEQLEELFIQVDECYEALQKSKLDLNLTAVLLCDLITGLKK